MWEMVGPIIGGPIMLGGKREKKQLATEDPNFLKYADNSQPLSHLYSTFLNGWPERASIAKRVRKEIWFYQLRRELERRSL